VKVADGKGAFMRWVTVLLIGITVSSVSIGAMPTRDDITGRWQVVNTTALIDFHADGRLTSHGQLTREHDAGNWEIHGEKILLTFADGKPKTLHLVAEGMLGGDLWLKRVDNTDTQAEETREGETLLPEVIEPTDGTASTALFERVLTSLSEGRFSAAAKSIPPASASKLLSELRQATQRLLELHNTRIRRARSKIGNDYSVGKAKGTLLSVDNERLVIAVRIVMSGRTVGESRTSIKWRSVPLNSAAGFGSDPIAAGLYLMAMGNHEAAAKWAKRPRSPTALSKWIASQVLERKARVEWQQTTPSNIDRFVKLYGTTSFADSVRDQIEEKKEVGKKTREAESASRFARLRTLAKNVGNKAIGATAGPNTQFRTNMLYPLVESAKKAKGVALYHEHYTVEFHRPIMLLYVEYFSFPGHEEVVLETSLDGETWSRFGSVCHTRKLSSPTIGNPQHVTHEFSDGTVRRARYIKLTNNRTMVGIAYLGIFALPPGTPLRGIPISPADAGTATEDAVPKPRVELVVEALIDGPSKLHLRRDGIYWSTHSNAAKVGKHMGQDAPTYVNGAAWKPLWHEPERTRGIDRTRVHPMKIGSVRFNFELIAISFRKGGAGILQRGPVTRSFVGDECIVNIPDGAPGSAWYRFKLFR